MDFSKVADAISWILLGIGIIFVFWYVFGDSPTLEQSLLLSLTAYIFKLHFTSGRHDADIKSIKSDANQIKEGMHKLSEDLQSIKDRL